MPYCEPDGAPNYKSVVAAAALTGETINLPDAYNAPGFDFAGTRAFDARTGYRSQSFLNVPLKNHEAEVVEDVAGDRQVALVHQVEAGHDLAARVGQTDFAGALLAAQE